LIALPSSERLDVLSDWAESCVLFEGNSISRATIESTLDDSGVFGAERMTGDIWQVIHMRHSMAGAGHPIETSPVELTRNVDWKQCLAYAFQLLLVCQSYYDLRQMGAPLLKASKMFEKLATEALKVYLSGESINLGPPREAPVPREFHKCVDHISAQTREARGTRRQFSPNTQDEKLDVVCWRSFGDGRSGQVIILAQCATGKDWTEKGPQLKTEVWQDLIDFAVEPIRALAFPFVILSEVEWRYHCRQAGVLLDRLRTASLLASKPLPVQLESQLSDWCTKEIKRLLWSVS
jgi:hypothetical protein